MGFLADLLSRFTESFSDKKEEKVVPECCPTPENCKDECNDNSCCCDVKVEEKTPELICDVPSAPLQVVEEPKEVLPVVEVPVEQPKVEAVVERLVEVSAKDIKEKAAKKATTKKKTTPKKAETKKAPVKKKGK